MKKSIVFPALFLSCIMSSGVVPSSTQAESNPDRRLERRRGNVQRPAPVTNDQGTADSAAPKTSVADDINPAQTSEDPTFGYTKENPVKLGSQSDEQGQKASSSHVYLRQLRDKARLPFKYFRIGNVGAGSDGHIVDLYKLTDSEGAEFKVFVDMYHPESNPLDCKAPKGMFIAQ